MTDRTNGRGLETLSSILALVLGEQPGEAAAALEAVRRKAKHDGVTGGTLKRIVRQIASQTEHETHPAFMSLAHGAGMPRSGRTIAGEMEERLRGALQDNAILRRRLDHAEGALARRSERGTLAGLERHFHHADRIELDLRRRTFDLHALREEMDNQRRRDEARVTASRRAWRNGRLGLAIAVLSMVLVSDGIRHGRTMETPMESPAAWVGSAVISL